MMHAMISIHALRVEGDAGPIHNAARRVDFYPRPPGGGRPLKRTKPSEIAYDFYPRPPGGGRLIITNVAGNRRAISIHALRVEGDAFFLNGFPHVAVISIHALRVEGDCSLGSSPADLSLFLSTPSGWRATGDGFPDQ